MASSLSATSSATQAQASPLEHTKPPGEDVSDSKSEHAAGSPPDDPGAGGPGGPGGRPKLDKYAYSFWAPQLAPLRKVVYKILGGTVFITIIIMWLCLPLYWGSLWKSNKYTHKLTVRVIDRDGGFIGQGVTQGLLSHKNLNYFTTPASEFPTNEDVAHDVVQEGSWAAIVIAEGATTALQLARSTGNSSYNGSQVVEAYYAQARQENAVGSYLLPYMQAALSQVTAQLSAESAAQYLQQNAGNQTAMQALASAPTTISNPISFTINNIRPYNQPVATAITLVGLIYMLIFSFTLTMANNAARGVIAPYLTTRSYIMYRLAVPMTLYLPVSFAFSMVNLPFKVHFGAKYTYAGGFFLWATILYIGMASVGLATEFAVTLLGAQYIAFFLVPLIIVNVSVAVMPHELQPWIFRYGVAMPFYNAGRAVRTIIFDTKNEIGRNCGILIAWVALSFITISLGTWLTHRKAAKAHQKELEEKRDGQRI